MLWASGWTLDDTLGLTWDQIGEVAAAVAEHRVEQANLLLGPLFAALGVRYRPGRVRRDGDDAAPTGRRVDDGDSTARATARDARLLHQLAAVGIEITDE